mgnify:CR=1 FL=1
MEMIITMAIIKSITKVDQHVQMLVSEYADVFNDELGCLRNGVVSICVQAGAKLISLNKWLGSLFFCRLCRKRNRLTSFNYNYTLYSMSYKTVMLAK